VAGFPLYDGFNRPKNRGMIWPEWKRERLIVSFVGISSTSPAHSPNPHSNIIQGFQKLQIASAACGISETIPAAGTSST
jgi:hypothetical protein